MTYFTIKGEVNNAKYWIKNTFSSVQQMSPHNLLAPQNIGGSLTLKQQQGIPLHGISLRIMKEGLSYISDVFVDIPQVYSLGRK